MLPKISQQSIAPCMAMLFYLFLGGLFLFNGTIITIGIGLLLLGATVGAYYKNQPLLGLVLVILTIACLISLITIAPLDPDFTFDKIDNYNKDIIIRIIITIFLYGLFLTYFYFLNKMKPFPNKQIVGIFILFSFITILIIYFRFFY